MIALPVEINFAQFARFNNVVIALLRFRRALRLDNNTINQEITFIK